MKKAHSLLSCRSLYLALHIIYYFACLTWCYCRLISVYRYTLYPRSHIGCSLTMYFLAEESSRFYSTLHLNQILHYLFNSDACACVCHPRSCTSDRDNETNSRGIAFQVFHTLTLFLVRSHRIAEISSRDRVPSKDAPRVSAPK